MLKIGCFKQNYCISGMPKGIPMQFLLNSGESQVTVTSFTHIHSKFYYLQNFNSWKMLKMLKLSCFELF